MGLRDLRGFLKRVTNAWRQTPSTPLLTSLKVTFAHRTERIWVILSCDIEPRELFCDFFRARPGPIPDDMHPIVLSTHVVRRLQTNLKLLGLSCWSRLTRTTVCVLSTDGFSGASMWVRPHGLILVSQWFNSPDEADDYWNGRTALLENTRRLEFFPERPGVEDSPPTKDLVRISRNFIIADSSDLASHFPTIRQVVFASDITIDLRPDAHRLRDELQRQHNVNIDDLLWEEARMRVHGAKENHPLTLSDLLAAQSDGDFDPQFSSINEKELDALRLTMHGRERYLFVSAIASSDLSDSFKLIGATWRQFPSLRPFVIDQARFPGGKVVSDLQRSRVCPDFGSSLGSMPLYGRAQTLASRATGLLQRFDPSGNPLLGDLENRRLFKNSTDLIRQAHVLLNYDETLFRDDEERIRRNYAQLLSQSRSEFSEKLMKFISAV